MAMTEPLPLLGDTSWYDWATDIHNTLDTATQPADLGTAAALNVEAFATQAQGTLADTATQPGDLGTAAASDTGDFATAAQGTLADSALQPGDVVPTVVLTQAAYDALTPPDASTMYFVVG